MPVNRQTVRELSRTTLYNITSSGQAWRAFLDAAARLYKYSFPEQVLIYAQEPEATACAAKEVWYTRMKRSLRPDAQAIALPDPHSHFGRLKYVFDVRETQPLPGAPEFRQWSLPFEALERVTDRLGQEYGISREPVVADRVYALVMNAPRELYPMKLTAMLRAADAEGRWSGQDDAALARQFHQLVADSAAYMVGVRVGIGTGAVTSDALESITRFNSSGLAALAGTYASRLAASVLRDVERAARENDRLAFPARGVQNEGREEFSHAAEAAKEVQDNDIYNTERSALPGPDAGGTGDSTGQIRPAAPPIPGEKRPRSAEHPAAGGRAEQPSGADRPSGARAGGADDGASGTAHEAAGQTDGPAWLGRDDEQPAPAGGGNGDGTDLRQLSLFPAEEEIQETGRSDTERPVSLSPDEIDDILRCDREYKKGCKKQDIESFFSTTMDMQERKAFLADAMGHIYTELFIGNHRYGYCNRGNGTVEFWRGGYLSARAKTTLTLLEVAERAAQLIEQGTYRREAPPAAFPIVEDAREEQADGTEAPKTARAGFSEAEINAVLCHGSGFSKGKFRIAEWYGGKHTEKETADFLKHEYGVGGMTWTFPDGTHGSVDYNMYGRPGISVIRGTGMDAPYQLLKWPEAARRIGRLVKDGLYLTDEEEQQYPEWKREKQAQKLKAVRRDAAREPPAPQRPCAVDDTVYLEDGKAFRIVEISGDGVRLEDADFPLLMRKESMEAFAALLRADTRNAQFLPPGPASGQAMYTEAPRDLSLPFSGDRYLDLKDQYNRYALGCGNDAYFLFYDEDARVVSGALHTKVLHADVPPLGEVDVTGFLKEQRPAYLKKLLCAGVDTALFEPGAGQPEPVRLCRAAEALPRGGIIEIEGREHSITEVNFMSRTVILKDMEPAPGQPRYTTMDVSSAYDAFQEDGQRMAELPQAAQVQKDTPPVPKLDYRYPTESASPVGPKARFALNAAAIGTLRRIEDEGRMATAEEQGILARYVGWGGLADAFDGEKTEWEQEYAQLKSLLDESEYMAARASTLTAFYTPPTVIRAMYSALERWGVTGGNILEPSMGVGAFFGCRPEQFDTNPTGLYGVELDHISARIAGQLYQSAHIYACGYEKTALPDSFFDCAVGNVPFGSFGVHDTRYDREHWLIHDYFFGKTIDKVRVGGIIAFITSSGTLDKASGNVRRYIAQRCELIGAVRLPSDTFRQSAGTEVTSDILFLQKRERMADRDEPWLHVGKTGDGVPINQYFVEHPEMVLGDMVMESGPFGPRSVCRPRPGQDLGAALHAALEGLDARLPAALPLEQAEQEIEVLPADPDVRNYSFTEVDGRLYFRENSVMRAVELDGANTRRVRELIALRGQTRRLMQVQLDGCGDAAVQLEQDRLNRLYDNFVRRYGRINSRGNAGVFRDDSGYFLLCALEVFDDEGNFKCKSDMFTKRTIQARRPATEVGTASEALAVSISERACVDLPYMAQLLRTEDQDGIIRALQGAIFRDPSRVREGIPESGWVTADEYLSGNVREKLHTAQKAAEADAAYVVNVSALEQVQPAPVEAGDIEVHLGATWIPVDVVKDFMVELLEPSWNAAAVMEVIYVSYTGQWNITNKAKGAAANVKANETYGTERINGFHILEASLNMRTVKVYDTKYDTVSCREIRVLNKNETILAQQKQDAMKQAFRDWLFKDPARRERLVKLYNEKFNCLRGRAYDGSHISFHGMSPEIVLREHQRNAVARILYGGNTLLAHVVGAGKTYTMAAAAMEAKRLGLCSKSLVVVPNHLTEQWGAEWLQLYPGANILVATKVDFETANRKKFCGRIATGDYDAVIIGHSQLEKIPLSAERQAAMLQRQIDEITTQLGLMDRDTPRFTVKQMERTRKGLETRLERLNDDSRKDDVVTFEELGIDRLFIDEAHNFKNLFLYTKLRNVAGVAQTEAKKSSDLFAKCQYLDELTGGRGVVFATGTPISNSMAELYTMMRYLQYGMLQDRGLTLFDEWASTFGEVTTSVELKPEGTGYRMRTRFSRFYNLPELMALWREAADIQTADMLNLPVPEVERKNVVVKPTNIQREMVAELGERAEAVRNGNVDPSEDNMLKITNDGRKLALDQRLIDPLLPDEAGSKVNASVEEVFRLWQEFASTKGTQLVFCDLSTPKAEKKIKCMTDGVAAVQAAAFSVYADVRDKLIGHGVPPGEIAFIHDADNEKKKAELFAKVRSGKVRILLGSTQKMGAGTNVQTLLAAEHHLDVPWRPSDIEQREGRAIRQGNTNKKVFIHRYVTEGTFDSYSWQLIETKQRFISQVMSGKAPSRSCEDLDEAVLSYGEIKALSTGNPHILEKVQLETDVTKLRLLKSSHVSQRYRLEDMLLLQYPQQLLERRQKIGAIEKDIPRRDANTPEDREQFFMTVMGREYTDKAAAGAELLALCQTVVQRGEAMEIGSYRGFAMRLEYRAMEQAFVVGLRGTAVYFAELGTDVQGNLARLNNALNGMEAHLKKLTQEISEIEKQQENTRQELEKPFAQEQELAEKEARLSAVNALLNIDGKNSIPDLMDDTLDIEPPQRAAKDYER